MKLTWFGGTTLRLHIGGRIIVVDADTAPAGIEARELRSGADTAFGFGADVAAMPALAADWQQRRPSMLDDRVGSDAVQLWQAGPAAVLIDAVGESPLLLAAGPVAAVGRWSREAVVVVLGDPDQVPGLAMAALNALAPRLLAIAAPEPVIDASVAALRAHLGSTSLVALEGGQALEV